MNKNSTFGGREGYRGPKVHPGVDRSRKAGAFEAVERAETPRNTC